MHYLITGHYYRIPTSEWRAILSVMAKVRRWKWRTDVGGWERNIAPLHGWRLQNTVKGGTGARFHFRQGRVRSEVRRWGEDITLRGYYVQWWPEVLVILTADIWLQGWLRFRKDEMWRKSGWLPDYCCALICIKNILKLQRCRPLRTVHYTWEIIKGRL